MQIGGASVRHHGLSVVSHTRTHPAYTLVMHGLVLKQNFTISFANRLFLI